MSADLCGFAGGCAQSVEAGSTSAQYPAMKLEKDKQVEVLAAAQVAPQPPVIEKSPPIPGRVMVYTGLTQLVVADIRRTLDEVQQRATVLGGYVQERDATSIIVRVPAARHSDLIAAVAKLGDVIQQQLKAQ